MTSVFKMSLARLNNIGTTLMNKQKKKSWSQSDAELVYCYIEQLRAWLDDLEQEFDSRGEQK